MVEAETRGRLRQAASDTGRVRRRRSDDVGRDGGTVGHVGGVAARIRLALGLPTDVDGVISGAFPELLEDFRAGVTIFGEEPILSFSHVIGAESARRRGPRSICSRWKPNRSSRPTSRLPSPPQPARWS